MILVVEVGNHVWTVQAVNTLGFQPLLGPEDELYQLWPADCPAIQVLVEGEDHDLELLPGHYHSYFVEALFNISW